MKASLPFRRHMMHRRVGEALAASSSADPDAVAYHFRQAGDDRAAKWIVKAGERAEQAYAWLTAAERFEGALSLMEERGESVGQQNVLRYRLAILRQFSDRQESIALMERVVRSAGEMDDRALWACATFYLGVLLCSIGSYRRGMTNLDAGVTALGSFRRGLVANRCVGYHCGG